MIEAVEKKGGLTAANGISVPGCSNEGAVRSKKKRKTIDQRIDVIVDKLL